jgi:RNA polymerase sigma-70 factor (ECF subfamily)
MVFSIALRILNDRFLAEEAAQDVFLELHAKLNEPNSGLQPASDQSTTFHSQDHITHWLRRAIVHRSIDRIRQRDRRAEVALETVTATDLPDLAVEAPPGDPLLSRQLRQLVAALPATPRAVIALRYQEERSPDEIAELLSMPVATVKSHLRRTLRLLREKLTRVLR